nr:hypothetical protein [Allomuricauda sp.]
MSYLPISGGSPASTTPPIAGGGTKGGSVLGSVSAIGSVANLLGGIVSSEVIGKTIGQALKDGFKCWGSTWTPTRAENELPQWISIISNHFKQALDVPRGELEQSVNNFFKTFWGKSSFEAGSTTLENWIGWRYDTAKDCTKRGLIALEKGVDSYLNNTLVPALKQIGPEINATITVTSTQITLRRTNNKDGSGGTKKAYTKVVPQIRVKLKADVVEDVKDLAGNKTLQFFGGVGLAIAALFALFAKTDNKKKGRSKAKKLYR